MTIRPLCLGSLLLVVGAASGAGGDKIDDLTSALGTDPSFKVRLQAAVVLGRLGDRRAVPALISALHDGNEAVRGVAVQALGQLGDERALEAVRAARDDSSPLVRFRATTVLPVLEARVAPVAAAEEESESEPATVPAPAVAEPSGPPPVPDTVGTVSRGARFFVTQRIAVRGAPPRAGQDLVGLVQGQLARLPRVAVRMPDGDDAPGAERLASLRLSGWIVDGNVDLKLGRARLPSGALGLQLECELQSVIATWPARAIKARSSVSVSIPGVKRLDDAYAVRQCLESVADQIASDVRRVVIKGG